MLAKNLQAAVAGQAAGGAYIEDVFSTYLYTGNGSTQTITNGIDLATEGGLVWIKNRNFSGYWHELFDTERGATKRLFSNDTSAEVTQTGQTLTSFNSDGFSLVYTDSNAAGVNSSGNTFTSWTFRKAPKFFDVVTYTGNGGTNTNNISHLLDSVPGAILIKATSTTSNWLYVHTYISGGNLRYSMYYLNTSNPAFADDPASTAITSTTFNPGYFTNSVGTDAFNASGTTYVAYLFASDAGGFGDAGDQSIIKCGSFTTDGSGAATVDLGWEPQWVLQKRYASGSDSGIFDNMRGMQVNGSYALWANLPDAEQTTLDNPVRVTSTGFTSVRVANSRYDYIAIRRGPMKTPTDGTSVFTPVIYTGDGTNNRILSSTITSDSVFSFYRGAGFGKYVYDRLRGDERWVDTTSTSAESNSLGGSTGRGYNLTKHQTNLQLGLDDSNWFNINGESYGFWNFKRAPGFFDVVCYSGDGTDGRNINHNLGVAPELMIVKPRSGFVRGWTTYLGPLSSSTNDVYAMLNETTAAVDSPVFYDTAPTSTVFTVSSDAQVNNGTTTYVAYLFASCPGVSKVGSFTGNGSSLTVDCGFTNGARFVMIKRTDSTSGWYVWDTVRGIVAGNDARLRLESTAAEASWDDIDPDPSGFVAVAAGNINVSGGTYIFLAIA